MVDHRLHALTELASWRQCNLAIVGQPWAGGERIDGLLQNLQALSHLLDAYPIAVVAVAVRTERHLEVVLLVARIGKGLADVVVDAGGAQHGAADAGPDRILG